MATKYSTVANEPIKDILDRTHNRHITELSTDFYGGDQRAIPVAEHFGGRPITSLDYIERIAGLTASEEGGKTTFRLSASASQDALPDADPWLRLLAGETYSWRHESFTSDASGQGSKFKDNPIRLIPTPPYPIVIEITNTRDPAETVIAAKEKYHTGGCYAKAVKIRMSAEKEILIDLIEERTTLGKLVSLLIRFHYYPGTGSASIREVMEGRTDRIKEFYCRLWFGYEKVPLGGGRDQCSDGGCTQVTGQEIDDFVHVVGDNGEAFVERPRKAVYVPMDFAIAVGRELSSKLFSQDN